MNEKNLSRGITSTSNFCAHRLIFSQGKVAVKATAGNYIFFGIFIAIGLGVMIAPYFAEGEPGARIGMSVFGLIFAGAGFFGVFKNHKRLPEIDLMRRMFYPQPRKYDPADMTNITSLNGGIPLSELVKIEVSTRHVRGNKSSYTAYMLDLIFRDGYSCRLLSHGGRKQFIEDAEKLSQLLNMPLTGLEETRRQPGSLKAGGIIMIVFGIFWLGVCSSMFPALLFPALKKITSGQYSPEVFIQIIFPGVFILVGAGVLIGGIVTLIKSAKKQ